jgi:hypothetical protein
VEVVRGEDVLLCGGFGLRDRAFLERLVGNYDIMGMSLAITLQGEDTLVGTLPGQPSLELVP